MSLPKVSFGFPLRFQNTIPIYIVRSYLIINWEIIPELSPLLLQVNVVQDRDIVDVFGQFLASMQFAELMKDLSATMQKD